MDLCYQPAGFVRFYRDVDFVDDRIVGVLWDLYFLTDECIEFDQKLELWFETVFERMEKLWHFSNLRHHRADVANSKNYLVVERISVAGTATPGSTFEYDCEQYYCKWHPFSDWDCFRNHHPVVGIAVARTVTSCTFGSFRL